MLWIWLQLVRLDRGRAVTSSASSASKALGRGASRAEGGRKEGTYFEDFLLDRPTAAGAVGGVGGEGAKGRKEVLRMMQ